MNSTSEMTNIKRLQDLLEETIHFKKCERDHHNVKENFYCFDCKLWMCQYCISSHNLTPRRPHNLIQIHVYRHQNSVSTAAVQDLNLIDIWGVKDYHCDGKRVMLLHANPYSSRSVKQQNKCENCHAVFRGRIAHYCSLACKVSRILPQTEIGSSVQTGSNPSTPTDLTEENENPAINVPKRRKMSSS